MTLSIKRPDPDGLIRIRCAGGAMLEAPIWETHARGTNYLAIIDVDPTMPGGLARRFIQRGKGDCFYLTEQLAKYEALEFAGDYTTSVGKRNRVRLYAVVVEKKDDIIVFKEYEKGVLAILAATEARTQAEAVMSKIRVAVGGGT